MHAIPAETLRELDRLRGEYDRLEIRLALLSVQVENVLAPHLDTREGVEAALRELPHGDHHGRFRLERRLEELAGATAPALVLDKGAA